MDNVTRIVLAVFHTESWFLRWQGRGHDALGVGKYMEEVCKA